MKDVYKVYTPEGEALIFRSLSEVKKVFNLDAEEVKKCFLQHVYTTKEGIEIIHYF
jgi:hypothetical protein